MSRSDLLEGVPFPGQGKDAIIIDESDPPCRKGEGLTIYSSVHKINLHQNFI